MQPFVSRSCRCSDDDRFPVGNVAAKRRGREAVKPSDVWKIAIDGWQFERGAMLAPGEKSARQSSLYATRMSSDC